MSVLLTDRDLKTEREVAREPARGWRNWWLILSDHITIDGFHKAGDRARGHKVWPSKDTAETAALQDCVAFDALLRAEYGMSGAELHRYLGAFPEGETP